MNQRITVDGFRSSIVGDGSPRTTRQIMTADPLVHIVDDDPSIRTALQRLFASVGLKARGFSSASEFLANPPHEGPECIVLDIRMPGTTGLDLQHELNNLKIETPIIFVSAHVDVPITVQAMKAGAVELLTKPFDDQALLSAVQQALDRDRRRKEEARELSLLREHYESLTSREREVMTHVVGGLLNKQVAAMLGTSEKTIKVHRARVMRKMDAMSLAHLVRMADRLGITPSTEHDGRHS